MLKLTCKVLNNVSFSTYIFQEYGQKKSVIICIDKEITSACVTVSADIGDFYPFFLVLFSTN